MYLKNVWFTLLWRILIIISTAYGVYGGVFLASGDQNFGFLLYYTTQSNLWCLILYLCIVFRMIQRMIKHQPVEKTLCSSWIKGGFTGAIIVTFLLYQLVIIPYCLENGAAHQIFSSSDIAVHYLSPFLVLSDLILFDDKKRYKWYTPIQWLAIPITYFLFIICCSFINVSVPEPEHPFLYFFLDIERIGIKTFSFNIIKLTLIFLVAGYFIVLLNDLDLFKKE